MKRAIAFLIFLVACGDSRSEPDVAVDATSDAAADTNAPDAVADTGSADAVADTGGADAREDSGDAGLDAPEPMDVGDDSAEVDAADDMGADALLDAADAGADCGYIDLDVFIVDCDAGYRYARRWQTTRGDAERCPDYYTLGRERFDSLEDTLASDSCDPDCLRGAGTSVTLLRCGVRTGYIVYRDAEPDCEEVIETADGLFSSVEAWDEAAPCE